MNQREIQFLIQLRTLLQTHGVELEATDDFPGYPECGQDIRIRAYAAGRSAELTDTIDVDFGSSIDVESITKLFQN
jgi:hypothetical protein